MTNKAKKEWLSRYLDMWKDININLEEIAILQSRAEKITPTLSDMPHGGTGSDFTVTVDKLVELKQKLEIDVLNAINKRGEIESAINEVSNPLYRRLLQRAYIIGSNLNNIAKIENYDAIYLRQLHSDALTAINIPD